MVAPVQPLLTAHFSMNNGFFGNGKARSEHASERGEHEKDDAGADDLLSNVSPLRPTDGAAAGVQPGIRCIAVQGGQDYICPPRTALALHDAWPEMELRIVLDAGHSMYDPRIASELIAAVDQFKDAP